MGRDTCMTTYRNIFRICSRSVVLRYAKRLKISLLVLFHPSCNYCTSPARYSIGRSFKFILKVAVEE
jgi:hypothetical protein